MMSRVPAHLTAEQRLVEVVRALSREAARADHRAAVEAQRKAVPAGRE